MFQECWFGVVWSCCLPFVFMNCSRIVFFLIFLSVSKHVSNICQEVWFGGVCSCCLPLVFMNCSRILFFFIFRSVSKTLFNHCSSICQELWFGIDCSCCLPCVFMNCSRMLFCIGASCCFQKQISRIVQEFVFELCCFLSFS